MFNKKGISPIVATLLLLSFAVAIALVFFNFGKAQVELSSVCPISIGLTEKNICSKGNQIDFTISNGINTNIEGLIINVIGTIKAETFELSNAKISKGGTFAGTVPYFKDVSGTIRQIKISPKILLYNTEHICIEKAIVKEIIPTC